MNEKESSTITTIIVNHTETRGRPMHQFQQTHPNATALDWQNVIMEHGRGWDAYTFARDITGADITALQAEL